uniref:Sushi domain-containing protein n=2 Tax=Hucho hucho TaxID=62062 RepID=A0A4W5M100_9TELE
MENQGSLLPPPSIFLHLGLPLSLLFSLSTSLSFSPSPSVGQGCNIPKELLNGRVQERSLTTGRAVAFQCDKGYALQGDALVACVGDGTWSTIFPFCQPKPCPPPPGWKESSGSGNTSKRLFYVGQSLPFTCPKGHQAKGTATITCRSDQTWTSVSSACETVCWLQCLNGGVCHRPNTCSCPEGWMGRLCEEPICILPCLNGGRCAAPYQCECPTGWTGTRCHSGKYVRVCHSGGCVCVVLICR